MTKLSYQGMAGRRDSRRSIVLDTFECDLARDVARDEVLGLDADVLATDVELVRAEHLLIEDVHRDLDKRRMGDPRSVMTGSNLTDLVGLDLGHGGVIGLWVVLDGDLGGH